MAIATLDTELSAVNLCLSGIGREPVASIDTPDIDADMALTLIRQTSHDLQSNGGRGWWFNRERGWNLAPNPDNGVTKVPNNTLSIIEARSHYFDATSRLAVRGDKVYDLHRHTYDLREISGRDGMITFHLVLLLDYELLPPAARSAIAWQARRLFSADTEGDPNRYQMQGSQEDRSMALLYGEERKQSRSNHFNNPYIQNTLARIRGGNSNY